MTDLLGLLTDLQRVIALTGTVRIAQSAIDGYTGLVDHETLTIHIQPGLSPDEWLATLAESLRNVIGRRGDPFGMETFGPVTADGAQVIPMWPQLRPVSEP